MNILIVDDHLILKEGITTRIKKILPESSCHFVDNIRIAFSMFQTMKIDLVLCDVEFNDNKEFDGFYFMNNIVKINPNIKVIAFTNYNSYRIMKKAITSGFASFLDKACSVKNFEDTIINVINQGDYCSETMRDLFKKRNEITRSIFSDSMYGISELSKKELELTLLSKETTDRQKLAKLMGNTPYTIDTYFKNIVAKLKLKNRQDIAFFSVEFYDELLKLKVVDS